MPPEDLRRQVAASMGTAISRGQAPLYRRSQQAPRRLTQNQIKCSICSYQLNAVSSAALDRNTAIYTSNCS